MKQTFSIKGQSKEYLVIHQAIKPFTIGYVQQFSEALDKDTLETHWIIELIELSSDTVVETKHVSFEDMQTWYSWFIDYINNNPYMI